MADRDSVLEIRNVITRGEIYNSYFPLHLKDLLKQNVWLTMGHWTLFDIEPTLSKSGRP